jgi:predicted TIM-barrel fold metal-dependent hydrolase
MTRDKDKIPVDWHTNLWLDEHMGPAGVELAQKSGRSVDATPEAHRAIVAETAEKFVVITTNWPPLGARVPNEWVADYVAQFPRRAIGLACVDPNNVGAPAEFENAILKLGLRGLKLAPVYQGFDPWCANAWALYDMANSFGVPILWHQAAAAPQQGVLEWANPVLLDKVARAFPNLKMILAHVGTPWIGETVQLLRKHKQLFTDLSARFYRKWELYTAMMQLIDYRVIPQVLFGSDFPMQTPMEAADAFREIAQYSKSYALPPIPETVIEDIIMNRPLDMIWSEQPITHSIGETSSRTAESG